MTDFRKLCREMYDAFTAYARTDKQHDLLDHVQIALSQPEPENDVALLRAALEATAAQRRAEDDARLALAQPEPEVVGPTDEELLATLNKATADFPPRHPEAEALNAVEYPLALELRKARAVLARFGGRPAPLPAAPGEVEEVAAWLRAYCDEEFGPLSIDPDVSWLTRAADLLERQATGSTHLEVGDE